MSLISKRGLLMTKVDAIKWRAGDVVVRVDLDVMLRVDQYQPNTDEYFVRVAVWDDNACGNGDYVYIEDSDMLDLVAAVSGAELDEFVASGVNPKTVDILIKRFGE